MDPVSPDELHILFEKIYVQVINIFSDTSLSKLLVAPSEMRWLEKYKELKGGNSVVKYSALGTTEGGKIIELVIRLGSTPSEVLNRIVELFERKEDILMQLNSLKLIKNVILWNDEPISMNIDNNEELQDVFLIINITVIHEAVIDYITPMKRREMATSNGEIDFSLIKGNIDTLVLCHGHGYGDLDFDRPVIYADYNIKAFPDVVIDILNDKFAPCHCFDNVYMIACPIYQLKLRDIRILINNISGIIKKGGRLYLTWSRRLFPVSHSHYQNLGDDGNKVYEHLTAKYFDYEDYIEDFGRYLLVLRRK